MAHEHGNAVLFLAGILLAVGAGAVILLLAPVLGVGRSPLPRSVRLRSRDDAYATRTRLGDFVWRRPDVVWGALAVLAALVAGLFVAFRS